jgi:hypothetical protein
VASKEAEKHVENVEQSPIQKFATVRQAKDFVAGLRSVPNQVALNTDYLDAMLTLHQIKTERAEVLRHKDVEERVHEVIVAHVEAQPGMGVGVHWIQGQAPCVFDFLAFKNKQFIHQSTVGTSVSHVQENRQDYAWNCL